MKTGSKIILEAKEINRVKPANYKEEDLSFFKDGFTYHTNSVVRNSYTNIMATEFAIYDSNRVIRESLASPIHFNRMQYRYFLQQKIFSKKIKLPAGQQYLFVNDYWSNSHYHWFCDLLPKLWCIKDELKDFTLLLPSGSYISKNAVYILERANLVPGNIIFMEKDKYYQAASLSSVTHVCPSGTTNPVIMQAISNNIRNSSIGEVNGPSKIYVSREKAKYRKVLNESAVQACFKNHHYEIINFEDYALADQMNVSAGLSVMAGIHGAGLTNALFMPQQSNLLEFRRDGIHHNHCYWDIANAAALNYYYLFGKPDSDKPIEGNGCNLTIDIPQLEAVLQHLEKNA